MAQLDSSDSGSSVRLQSSAGVIRAGQSASSLRHASVNRKPQFPITELPPGVVVSE